MKEFLGIGAMKRILVTCTELMMLDFLTPHIVNLLNRNFEVVIGCSNVDGRIDEVRKFFGDRVEVHEINLKRSPYEISNIKGYKQLKKILKEQQFNFIWTNEPVMGVMTRIAAKRAGLSNTKIIYMAHGFHFYKGAPIKNWMLYYPVEWLCACWTDVLVTMNKEDRELAKKYMHAKLVEYVPGVGIDVERFTGVHVDRAAKRREIGVSEDTTLLVSVGELTVRKNHAVVIKALAQLPDSNIHYVIAGDGPLRDELQTLASSFGIGDRIHLLGYRRDIPEIYGTANICVFPSIQEGLPVAVMEAMASGLPCIVSDIRGNRDLIDRQSGGIMVDPKNVNEWVEAILCMRTSMQSMEMGIYNKNKVKSFSHEIVDNLILTLFEE